MHLFELFNRRINETRSLRDWVELTAMAVEQDDEELMTIVMNADEDTALYMYAVDKAREIGVPKELIPDVARNATNIIKIPDPTNYQHLKHEPEPEEDWLEDPELAEAESWKREGDWRPLKRDLTVSKNMYKWDPVTIPAGTKVKVADGGNMWKHDIMRFEVEDGRILDATQKQYYNAISDKPVDETIVKHGSGYRLKSHTGKNLGDFRSKKAAEKHEHEVNYFKHAKEGIEDWDVNIHSIPRTEPFKEKNIVIKSKGGKTYTFDTEEEAANHFGRAWPIIKAGDDPRLKVTKGVKESTPMPTVDMLKVGYPDVKPGDTIRTRKGNYTGDVERVEPYKGQEAVYFRTLEGKLMRTMLSNVIVLYTGEVKDKDLE